MAHASSSTINPILQSVLTAARDATGATRALLLVTENDTLRVVAADGDGASVALGAVTQSDQGIAGFVASSGQPVALRPTSTDERLTEDVATVLGWSPRAVLTVPCLGEETITGVLELLDPHKEAGFDFNDVEIATLLAGVAGVALETHNTSTQAPSPEALSRLLSQLAETEPIRYAHVALMVEALLDRV